MHSIIIIKQGICLDLYPKTIPSPSPPQKKNAIVNPSAIHQILTIRISSFQFLFRLSFFIFFHMVQIYLSLLMLPRNDIDWIFFWAGAGVVSKIYKPALIENVQLRTT